MSPLRVKINGNLFAELPTGYSGVPIDETYSLIYMRDLTGLVTLRDKKNKLLDRADLTSIDSTAEFSANGKKIEVEKI